MTSQKLNFKTALSGLSLPTLEEISIMALTTELLQEDEVKKIYYQHFLATKVHYDLSYSSVCKLKSLCKLLHIPDIVESKLVIAFHWMTREYINWIEFVLENLPRLEKAFLKKRDFVTHIMKSVSWSKGVIDKKKSVHQVLFLNNIETQASLKEMFRTASRFCLEDDLRILWGKMSEGAKKTVFLKKKGETCFLTLYWTCKMKGDMKDFMEGIPAYLIFRNHYNAVNGNRDLNNYALVLYIFEGDISGMKYFNELATVDDQDKVHFTRILLHQDYKPNDYQWVEKLVFWLKEIEDESILNTIIHKFAKEFLKISINYWPWHKLFITFLRMSGDSMDQVFVYNMITQLLENVNMGKVDILQVKLLWKNLPCEVKKLFCTYISNKQNLRSVKGFWEIVTIKTFNMILKDEQLKNILTPNENNGILECIYAGRYALIEFWLQKCLVSKEAIILYLENFIQTKSVEVIKTLQRKNNISLPIQFLNWAFKYEHLMNRDKILIIKDQAINENIIPMFVKGFEFRIWDDLKKLINWMVRNREHEYENELVKWKQQAIQEYFKELNLYNLNCDDFKSSLFAFLTYGVSDSEKIKVMMSKVDLDEGRICFEYLVKGDSAWIDNYLKILEGYGKDIVLSKENIFSYIFNHSQEGYFINLKFCESIIKLLYWGCENNQEGATKVEKIKMTIIKEYGVQSILRLVDHTDHAVMCNILEILFNGKMEKEEWSEMLFNLKMNAVKQQESNKDVWQRKDYYESMAVIISWGKESENIRNWDIKKYFIKCLKINIQVEAILVLILESNFICSFFKGDEAMPDFNRILWDLKEFLVDKAISEDKYERCRLLFKNFKIFTDFLNWNGFDKTRIENLKIKIIDEKGVSYCLNCIQADELHYVTDFFNWCINDNPFCDLKYKILDLKRNVLEMVILKHYEDWRENFFQRIDELILLHPKGNEEKLKKIAIEKHAVKGCSQCIINCSIQLIQIKAFIKWAQIEGEESIKSLKRNIMIEILDVKNITAITRWKVNIYKQYNRRNVRYVFGCIFDKFLYEYDNPDPIEIASLKLDVLEDHFFAIFEKILAENNRHTLIGFLTWSFDSHVKSRECLPRAQKLIKEMFEKYGKEYCIAMLRLNDVDAVADFLEFCLDFETDVKTFKSLLGIFKKDCINQFLSNEIQRTVDDWNPSLETLWNCLDEFMLSGPGSSSVANDILEYKDFVAQEYGIIYMEKYFECLLKDSSLEIPENFLKWLFGVKHRKSQIDLDEKKLLNFKKQVMETLININQQDLLKKDYFYEVLEEFLKFNLIPEDESKIYDLKKDVCEIQGITLCIDLICQNNVEALQEFLHWVENFFDSSYVDFKLAVVLGLAGNSVHTYSWETLELFLLDGFNLNHEVDRQKYSRLKEFATDSCSVDICYNWIVNRQWEEIPGFLEWCSENQDCKELKLKLLKKHGAEYCNACLMDDDWEKLETFLKWAFGSHENNIEREEEVINLKTETLNSEICYKDHLEILLAFLEWGFTSQDSLNKFKKSILELDHPLNYFVTEEKYKSFKKFQLWFAC